ncbi:hypothetical protein AMTR_s00070p00044280 [Amborella trichopoda]|uniref:Uncharacterized protein n=1 Tax=Amborella trichopoda TaxID=13333 RepID=U5DGH5_AMBTC|nr:hypothetical protein AMTR_s00070p00044280 [Amborella trichopoda]
MKRWFVLFTVAVSLLWCSTLHLHSSSMEREQANESVEREQASDLTSHKCSLHFDALAIVLIIFGFKERTSKRFYGSMEREEARDSMDGKQASDPELWSLYEIDNQSCIPNDRLHGTFHLIRFVEVIDF